jgi:LPS-assembly protein
VIRRLALVLALACCAAPSRAAQAAPPTEFTADHFSYDDLTKESVAQGNARLLDGKEVFTADEIRYNTATDVISASGHAAYTRGSERLIADVIVYHRADGTFTARNVRVGRDGIYIQGLSAEGTRKEVFVHGASITYGEPGRYQPTIRAGTIVYSPDHFVRVLDSWVGIGSTEIFPIPHISETFNGPFSLPFISFNPGYRSGLGGIADFSFDAPVAPGIKAGAEASLYTERGLMLGPISDYGSADGSGDLAGSIRSGFIEDWGKRGYDILGDPIPKARAFVQWDHQQQVTDDLTVDGELNWWSDSYVYRDFRNRSFIETQEPDNYLESVYTGANFFASAFTRFQPDAFEPVQQRLPELQFDLLPTAIGGGVYERFDASSAVLRELPPEGGPELGSDRLDAFYGLTRPVSPVSWFTFTPVAGVRVDDYFDTLGAAVPGGTTRVLGEFGFDAVLRSSGTFDYQNRTWKINGLRHLFTPYLSYRYIPASGADPSRIPDVDAETFDTYLPPIELGDARSVDALGPSNTLRVGLDNTLQTRDPTYGSRDLLEWRLADDILFYRQPGQRDYSQLYGEVGIYPAKWLEIDSQEIVEPRTGAVHEFESGLKVMNADIWTLRLATDFVRKEDDEYFGEWNVRLNEVFRAILRTDYDVREHRWDRREFGLIQNLNNAWKLEYTVAFDQGPSREGHFSLNMQIDVIRF